MAGARQIKLVMDDAGDGISADHWAWAEAKMSPSKPMVPLTLGAPFDRAP